MTSGWLNKEDPRAFSAIGEYFEGEAEDCSVLMLLNVDAEALTPTARRSLTPGALPGLVERHVVELSRGLRAYFQFQDILDLSVHPAKPAIENRHYCYYESVVYLRESVVSWLDGNCLAALALLRPFFELSILHLYWYLVDSLDDYQSYYDWIAGPKDKPKFALAIRRIRQKMPASQFVDPRRLDDLIALLHGLWRGLCAYNHTPKVEESIAGISGGGLGRVSPEAYMYALHTINVLLRQITYMFVLAYPMSLFPVDRYRKWGYSGPVGLFFDRCNFAILEAYLGHENVGILRRCMSSMPEVTRLTEWFTGLPDLSDAELETEWQKFRERMHVRGDQKDPESIFERLACGKAAMRSSGWFLNYLSPRPAHLTITDDAVHNLADRLRDW